jgi:hypothetical protein
MKVEWRKLHNKELQHVYSSSGVPMIKMRKTKLAKYLDEMRNKKIYIKI